jgi:hypothetical protein
MDIIKGENEFFQKPIWGKGGIKNGVMLGDRSLIKFRWLLKSSLTAGFSISANPYVVCRSCCYLKTIMAGT